MLLEFEMSTQSKRATKKETVLKTEKKNPLSLRTILVVAALVAGGLVFYVLQKGIEFTPKSRTFQPDVTAAQVAFPMELFNDGKAHHFQYPLNDDITVRFFVIKSSDGIVRAAYDACDVCWRAGKGYYQEGDFMVCRNCGRRFASVKVNEIKGGCNPAPLKRTVVGDKLSIEIADILKGRQYFDLTKPG